MDNSKIEKMKTFYYKEQGIKKKHIPTNVLFILRKLKYSGFLSFLVGGCVRDLLLKRVIRDWDIITDAKPKQIKMIFSKYKTLIIGKSFQTVTIVLNHKTYQVSAFRNISNQKLDDGHDGSFQILKDDLIYRDFTINAIAWNQDMGLLDPTNGLRDLKQNIIQSLYPDIRFKEDPLRMLRAVRFACELNFSISPEIKKSIIKYAFLIHYTSSERISGEICSILKSSDAKRGILLLQEFGLDQYIFSLDKANKTLMTKDERKEILLSGLGDLKEDLSAQLALLGRYYFGSCQAARVFYYPVIKCLRLKKKVIEKVKTLLYMEWQDIDFSSSIKIRFLIAKFGRKNIESMMFLKKIVLFESNGLEQNQLKTEERLFREELQKNYPVKLSDLAINGNDLIRMGISEGKTIGFILKKLLKEVIICPEYNYKKKLIHFVKKYIKK